MAKTAMIEKLFVQIFERKSWIIDKVDQQARLFDQHLASKLLIDGITPPSWLLNHEFRSRTSDKSELNAEELISGVLLSRSRSVIPFSYSQHNLYEETVAETGSSGEPKNLFTEECSQNEGFEGTEKVSALASVGDHCITSLEAPRDEDPSITSPQDLSLSLSRLRRSRSRQKALETRRSGKKPSCPLDNDGNLSGCSGRDGGSQVPSFQNYQLEELKLENSVDAQNEDFSVEDVKCRGHRSKEKISGMDSGRITRSKSSTKSQSALNVADSSNNVGKEDVLLETVVSSLQDLSHESSPLELDSGSRHGEIEAKVGEKRKEATWNSMDNKRITRSRNVSGAASTTESSHGALHFNSNQQIITKSVSTSKGPQEVIGRATRSRSKLCQDTSTIEPVPEALQSDKDKDLFTGSLFTTSNRSCSSKEAQVKDHQSSSIRDDEEPTAANSTDSSEKESVVEECVGTGRRPEPNSVVEVTSNNLGRRVTRSKSAASHKPPENKALQSSEATGSKELSHADIKHVPFVDTNEAANMEGRASTAKENEGDAGRAVEAQSVNSGSNLNDVSAAELAVGAPSPLESSMPMEPQEINFVKMEPSSVNDILSTPFGNEAGKLSEEKEPVVLFQGTGLVGSEGSEKESVVKECVGANRRSEPYSVVEVTSNNLGRRVTRSTTAASHKPLDNKLLYSLEATESKELSPVDSRELPCPGTNEAAKLEGRASTAKEAEGDPGREVEAQSVSSGSNLDDVSASELEVFAPSPLESSMPMEPRQLNFNRMEPSSVNIPSTSFGNEAEKLLDEKEPRTLLEGTGIVANRDGSESCAESDSLHLKERDDMIEEEACPRALNKDDAEEKEAATLVLNEHIESWAKGAAFTTKETCIVDNEGSENYRENDSLCPEDREEAYPRDFSEANTEEKEARCTEKAVVTHMLQHINECTDERSPLTGMNVNSKIQIETDIGTLAGPLPAELASKDVELETVLNVQSDADFSPMTRPDRAGDQQMRTNIELTGAVSKDECVLNTNEEIENSNLSMRCDDTVVECYRSGQRPELQTEEAGSSLEKSNSSANTPFTFAYEELEASLFPCLVRKTGGDSQFHFMEEEEARETYPTTGVFTDGDWRSSFDYGDLFLLKDNFGIGITEPLTGTKTSMQDNEFDLARNRKSSFDADATMPVIEGFLLQSDDDQQCIVDEEIRTDSMNLPKTAIERASILEKLCESACKQNPGSYSSVPHITNKALHLYQSVPTGLLEGADAKNKRPIREESRCDFQGTPNSDSFQYSSTGHDWNIKRLCLSPVQKVWERIISRSASSERQKSSSLELPSINEESENMEDVVADTFQGTESVLMDCSVKREPLAGIDENLVSEPEPYADRFSLNSVTTEFSFSATHDRTKNNLESRKSVTRRYNRNSNKENENPSLGPNTRNRGMGSLQSRFNKPKLSASTLSEKRGPGSNDLGLRRNNIVSNITSFIPLVQQKQASTVTAGKRDVKVKALEAAEAARRQAEKKENERRAKKEEMKLERAKQEQENLKQLELQKKKKEEERKKKEAEMAAKKRQREEEERKEKERKRFRVEETRKQQKEKEQKLRATKEERDKSRINEVKANNNKKIEKVGENVERILEAEPTTTRASTSDDRRTVALHQEFEALSGLINNFKANHLDKSTATRDLVEMPSQEQSYDISPYKCSDDEDEDEDDDDDDSDNARPRKFVPSWASKRSVLRAVISQDSSPPREIFRRNSFCTIAEAALPRRFYKNQ